MSNALNSSSPTGVRFQLIEFAHERFSAVVERFLPKLVVPEFFAGYRVNHLIAPELAYVGANLHALGKETAGSHVLTEAIRSWLRQVAGKKTETFYSYRVAETLLEFGPFKGNSLLPDFNESEKQNLRRAVDSTGIFDPARRSLRGYPNNYWAVLARCEHDRERLGLLDGNSLLELALEHTQELLFRNPVGFFDDSQDFGQRYDIYTADSHIFLEPLWHFFDREKLDFNLRQHVRLLETIALKNGACIAWGRSIGALSICMTMELAAISLRLDIAADPARSLRLLTNAFEALKGWFSDDLINAHRGPMTDGYRGPHRLLQMTLDCLGKVCLVARELGKVADTFPEVSSELFPATDELIPFDRRNSSVWMFRNEQITFQLPLVNGAQADYAPWFQSPGFLESPVDSLMISGSPRILKGDLEFTSAGVPTDVEKTPAALRIVYKDFFCRSSGHEGAVIKGQRSVTYRVEYDTIFASEHWLFDDVPDSITFHIPETERRLRLETNIASHQDTVAVKGIPEWRSCWGELHRLHQVRIVPQREVRFEWSLAKVPRIANVPACHDYNRALYDAMPAGSVAEYRLENCPEVRTVDLASLIGESEILHIGWPEHLFCSADLSQEDYDESVLRLIKDLGQLPVRVVWTMHNRRPHWWDAQRGKTLYQAWARIADGVIHHSKWGMDLIRAELPYKPTAKHVVIPHGHFGDQMPRTRSRDELEASFGLRPAGMRFGILGRWQPEKQVEMIIDAFHTAGRPDQQLVVTAYREETHRPDDDRIIFLPRENWLSRETIAGHVHLCDALVSAHVGDTYLTSGVAADAIGAGIPMITPRWEYFLEIMNEGAIYHDNTASSLRDLFHSITSAQVERARKACDELQSRYSWSAIAAETLAFYHTLPCP